MRTFIKKCKDGLEEGYVIIFLRYFRLFSLSSEIN